MTVEAGVARVVLDRPPLNLVDTAMLEALGNLCRGPLRDGGVRVVVLSGAAGVFSAGADVAELSDPRRRLGMLKLGRSALADLAALEVPVIAQLQGQVLGGGLELALAADLRWAEPEARLGLPEVGLGILPAWGGTQRLPRVVGAARALEMLWCQERLDAAEALAIGLVTRVVPRAQLGERVLDLARRIARGAPLAQRAAKRAVLEGLERGLGPGLALEERELLRLAETQDAAEGLRAFRERRAPDFSGR